MPNDLFCRAEIVRWVAESLRPYEIVSNRGFQCLMKTGRPEYYIPLHYISKMSLLWLDFLDGCESNLVFILNLSVQKA